MTLPFKFEGTRRRRQADEGIESLRGACDTVIVIPNDKLLQMIDHQIAILDAFKQADQVLMQGVSGITDLITTPGLINLDFADVKAVMSNAGSALMGIGSARGEDRARAASTRAAAASIALSCCATRRGCSCAGTRKTVSAPVNAAVRPSRSSKPPGTIEWE